MIFHVTGRKGTALDVVAHSLRNAQIAGGKGATIIPHDSDGDLRKAQLEKAIVGPLVADAKQQAWKPEAMIIIVGGTELQRDKLLAEIEALAPGTAKALGPVHTVDVR